MARVGVETCQNGRVRGTFEETFGVLRGLGLRLDKLFVDLHVHRRNECS